MIIVIYEFIFRNFFFDFLLLMLLKKFREIFLKIYFLFIFSVFSRIFPIFAYGLNRIFAFSAITIYHKKM